MTILRYGNKIALTECELKDAYYEQQHLFDLEDIRNYFENYDDETLMEEYGITREELETAMPQLAYAYRKNMDEYEMGWYDAREAAIEDWSYDREAADEERMGQ